jgi:2,3,4,5-tetrahydropyridine-2-carboxylate N-succinyltransferase
VIIEDGAFIGSRCIVTEGALIGAGAVLGANTTITSSIRIIDVTGDDPVDYRGEVPPNAVVVPGARPREFPAGTYYLQTPLIIGWRTESTDRKTTLNEALRVFGVEV